MLILYTISCDKGTKNSKHSKLKDKNLWYVSLKRRRYAVTYVNVFVYLGSGKTTFRRYFRIVECLYMFNVLYRL